MGGTHEILDKNLSGTPLLFICNKYWLSGAMRLPLQLMKQKQTDRRNFKARGRLWHTDTKMDMYIYISVHEHDLCVTWLHLSQDLSQCRGKGGPYTATAALIERTETNVKLQKGHSKCQLLVPEILYLFFHFSLR